MSKLHQIAIALVAVVFLAGATATYAQINTLTIRDGQVYVNGRLLDDDEIPDSLDPNKVNVNLSLPDSPTVRFEMDGRYYFIDGSRILEVDEEEESRSRTTVVFRDSPVDNNAVAEERAENYPAPAYRSNQYNQRAAQADNPSMVMQQYVFELTQNARQLNELSGSVSQAELTSQFVQDLPYLELQNYFSSVRAADELLYQRLINELELERETQRLAEQVRQLPTGDERSFKVQELREMLESILDLKQENRQMEIDQLEKQLAVLKQRFADREAKKDRMIERRIKELIGSEY